MVFTTGWGGAGFLQQELQKKLTRKRPRGSRLGWQETSERSQITADHPPPASPTLNPSLLKNAVSLQKDKTRKNKPATQTSKQSKFQTPRRCRESERSLLVVPLSPETCETRHTMSHTAATRYFLKCFLSASNVV